MAKSRSIRNTLKGKSRFITDLIPEHALHTALVRATISKGLLRSISLPDFEDGRSGYISAGHFANEPVLDLMGDPLPLFSDGGIDYRGQVLGILWADDEDELAKLLSQVQIEYENIQPGVYELDITAQSVNEEPDPNTKVRQFEWGTRQQSHNKETTNKDEEPQEFTLEDSFNLASQFHSVQESLTALASYDEGVLTVRTPAIWPHHLAKNLARILGLGRDQVEVETTIPGMYHDRLLVDTLVIGCLAALVTFRTGRPAVVQYEYRDEAAFATKQAPMRVFSRLSVHAELGIRYLEMIICLNMGAWPTFTSELEHQLIGSALRAYPSAAGRIELRFYRSNLIPLSLFHGFLSAQVQTCLEIQVNRAARLLKVDPIDFRAGLIGGYEQVDLASAEPGALSRIALLPAVGAQADFSRKYAAFEILRNRHAKLRAGQKEEDYQALRGMGFALGFQPNQLSLPSERAIRPQLDLELDINGHIHLSGSAAPGSSALKSHFRDILKESFAIPNEQISIATISSLRVPDAGPMTLSRSLTITRSLLLSACKKMAKLRFREALPLHVSQRWSPKQSKGAAAWQYPAFPTGLPTWAAAAVEVRIDPVSYQPTVHKIWMSIMAGRLLFPAQARAALQGSIIQAVNWCIHQSWEVDAGLMIPRIRSGFGQDVGGRGPEIQLEFLDASGLPIPERAGQQQDLDEEPLGIGELAQAVIPAALVSGLGQAAGDYFDSIPIGPEDVHRLLEGRKHEG